MSRPWRIRFDGAKYRVTVRGNNRQCVFHGEYFGYRGNGAVNKQRQRLRELLVDDRVLSRQLDKLEKAIAKN